MRRMASCHIDGAVIRRTAGGCREGQPGDREHIERRFRSLEGGGIRHGYGVVVVGSGKSGSGGTGDARELRESVRILFVIGESATDIRDGQLLLVEREGPERVSLAGSLANKRGECGLAK